MSGTTPGISTKRGSTGGKLLRVAGQWIFRCRKRGTGSDTETVVVEESRVLRGGTSTGSYPCPSRHHRRKVVPKYRKNGKMEDLHQVT